MSCTRSIFDVARATPGFDLRPLADVAPAQYRYAVDAARNLTVALAESTDRDANDDAVLDEIVSLLAVATLPPPTCTHCNAAPSQQLPVAAMCDGAVYRTDFRCARCAHEHPVWWT
jgi:hypothetical protein